MSMDTEELALFYEAIATVKLLKEQMGDMLKKQETILSFIPTVVTKNDCETCKDKRQGASRWIATTAAAFVGCAIAVFELIKSMLGGKP